MSYLMASLHLFVSQAVPAAEPAADPLWRLILRDFPHDAGAITLYVLLAASIALVWWANRNSGRSGARQEVSDLLGETSEATGEEADQARPGGEPEWTPPGDRRPVTGRSPAAPRRPRRAA